MLYVKLYNPRAHDRVVAVELELKYMGLVVRKPVFGGL